MSHAIADFEWRSMARTDIAILPPYVPHFEVLPNVLYLESVWELPEEAFPPGSRGLRFLDFLSVIEFGGVAIRLDPNVDAVLIDQLKQIIIALIHRPEVLSGFIKDQYLKVKSIRNYFTACRRLFCALKFLGITSLSDLNKTLFSELSTILAFDIHTENLKCFRITELLARQGMVLATLPEDRFIVRKGITAQRTSAKAPANTLTFEEVAVIIRPSRFYIDNVELIVDQIDKYYAGKQSKSDLAIWASTSLATTRPLYAPKVDEQLFGFIQVSAFNMIGLHLGPRTSETFSASRGFVAIHGEDSVLFADRLSLKMTTWKTIEEICGEVRFFPVHPYLQRVQRALELVADRLGVENDDLFVGTQTRKIYNTSNFNHRLEQFCETHSLSFSLTSYTWRNSLASITIQAATGGVSSLKELFGHTSASQTVAYGMKNPFIRPLLLKGIRKNVEEATDRLLAEVSAFGGDGLGGAQGLQLERSALELTARDQTQRSKDKARRHIASDLARLGFAPLDVDRGIKCWRTADARGLCAHSANDPIPDTENCQAECVFRVETSDRRDALLDKISSLDVVLCDETVPLLEKIRWSTQLTLEIANWPGLEVDLERKISGNPSLASWFRK